MLKLWIAAARYNFKGLEMEMLYFRAPCVTPGRLSYIFKHIFKQRDSNTSPGATKMEMYVIM